MARGKPLRRATTKIFVAFCLLAVSVPALWSQEQPITLDEAVARALSRHPDVLRARHEIDAAAGRRLQLEAIPNPELTFDALGLPLWKSDAEKEFSLGISQVIEFPGKRAVRRQIGLSGEDRARLEYERVEHVVRGRVERAYFRAAYAQRRIQDLDSILTTLKEYADLAAERYKSGQAPYLDVIRGRLETLRLQNEIVEARRDLKDKTVALDLLMGAAGFEPLRLSTEITYAPVARTLADLRAAALAGSAVRVAASLQKQATLTLDLAKKSGLPDFSVGLFLPSKRLGAWGVEFGLTLPIRRGEYRGAALEAEAATRQAAVAAEATSRRIIFVLERAYADAQALEEQIGLFQESLLRDVEESLQASLTNYQFGKSDALGVLDIVRSLKESRAEFLRALLNHTLALIDIATAGDDESIEVENVQYQ